jgi:Domain of unknown function (DUF1707)
VVERAQLRVSDSERQGAVDRLRLAHDEGRLDLDEYDRRLAAAYASKTYGDLDQLFLDLPESGRSPAAVIPAPRSAAQLAVRPGGVFVRMPLPLKVLWIIYASVVAINVTVWLLVSLSIGDAAYFWPMWLIIPGGALATVTASVDAHRRSR